MARATPGILAYNPAYRGSTLGVLKSPRGSQGMKDILKSEAGYYATLPGIAYLANKYGLEEDAVRDFINKIIIDTPEGKVFAPDKPEEQTLEEWKKQQESLPLDQTPPFVLPGFTPEETKVDTETFPIMQSEASILSTPPLREEEKTPIITTMADVTRIPKNLPMLNTYKDFINKTFSKPIKNISTKEHLIDSLSNQLGHTSKNQTFRVIKEMKEAGLFTKSVSKNYDDYLINRSAKVNKGLIALTSTNVEKVAAENSSKINNLINENYPNFKELSDLEKATILDDITIKVMKDSNTSISNFKKKTLRNKWNKLTGDDVKSLPHATKLEAGKKVKLTWNETPIFDPANSDASALNAKLQGNLRKDKRFDANIVIDNLRKNNSRVDELLNTIEGFKNIQSKTGAKNIGKRVYEVDHVQDFRFGGTNELDNFYITTKMPHRGLKKATALFKKIYPDKVMKSKSSFGDVVHKNYLTIIEHLKKGNFEAAEKLSMKTQKYIDDVIESKPAYSFIIDEPYKPHKTGSRYNEAEYINQVSLLPKELQAKAKELIVRREYVPDMFKTNLKGEARIIKQLEDFRDTTFNIPVDVRETQRFFNRGGLVGISHLTRPL